jgi:hypothetical protein
MLLFHSFLCYSLNPRQQGFQWEPWVKKLSIEQSNWLEKDATTEEVKQAVWDYDGVVTQFWIHQDFLKCYFISIIIYKNPKKLKKRKIQKYIFLESTASFHKNRFHRVNTGQTMSAK